MLVMSMEVCLAIIELCLGTLELFLATLEVCLVTLELCWTSFVGYFDHRNDFGDYGDAYWTSLERGWQP